MADHRPELAVVNRGFRRHASPFVQILAGAITAQMSDKGHRMMLRGPRVTQRPDKGD